MYLTRNKDRRGEGGGMKGGGKAPLNNVEIRLGALVVSAGGSS